MNMEMISYISLMLFIITLTIISLIFVYLAYKCVKTGEEIAKITNGLADNLTDMKVKEYMDYINSIKVPNRKVYWNTLRAGYELIEMNDNIDRELKTHLKITMLSKGIIL